MSKKMLIDARHPEETRVAILSNGKVEDFDFESASRKALRGNIYLARVTRVEPSLQAAFVEYGGNRHGFLAFSEIHPDYYQIPVADREILREADALEAELAAKLAELDGDAEISTDVALDEDDDDDAPSASAISTANDTDEEESRPTRSRRCRSRRRRRPSSAETAETGETSEADSPSSPEFPAQDSEPQEADSEPPQSLESADTTPTPEDQEQAIEADIETEDGPGPSSDADEDSDKTIGLEDPEPEISEEPEPLPVEPSQDDTAEAAEAVETRLETEGDEPALSDSSIEMQSEEESVAEGEEDALTQASDNVDEADQAVEPATDPTTEEAPVEKTEEEMEAERLAAERATEIAELRRRYEDARRQREKLLRNYRIQEVVKRRQILLVQVVKEERGNKGAALTTYMSLAGRYGVLMPNNARGGGVSRKITNSNDRKRLRKAISELGVPKGQGLIIRTAGAKRTKAEIKRDYDYLSRLWDTIREHTLKSIAPCAIYEEASLIKRAIRDLYDKDTSEVIVEGEDGYREAKDFMKMLMPSHAKHVQPYKERMPLFLKYGVEQQLDEMYQPVVNLKSGGYLVIQQTEALISVDVNSGKATKERSVEATALKTNSEAAVEMARQCRLRDLAGLLVIDFIDMDENKNNRAVEKKLRDAMKTDRARIQIGSISSFGLLEMSRQRRRSGIVDGTTRACPTCDGAGAVRSPEMAALRILRAIEEVAAKDQPATILAGASGEVALYILNNKRDWLKTIESTYGTSVEITVDTDKAGDQFDITKQGKAVQPESTGAPVEPTTIDLDDLPDESPESEGSAEEKDEKPKRKRRRKRRTKDDETQDSETSASEDSKSSEDGTSEETSEDTKSAEIDGEDDDKPKKRRRRSRRGGRKSSASEQNDAAAAPSEEIATETSTDPKTEASDDAPPAEAKLNADAEAKETENLAPSAEPAVDAAADVAGDPPPVADSKPKKKRVGWWSKALGKG